MLRKGDLVKWCEPGMLEEQIFGIVLGNQKENSERILVHWLDIGKPTRELVKYVQLTSPGPGLQHP